MQIRPVEPDDLERVVEELWVPLAREMTASDPYDELTEDARDRTLEYERGRLDDDSVCTLVAGREGDLVGYATATIANAPPIFTRDRELRIETLYVVPSARRSGVATRLLDRLRAWDREEGCETASVGVTTANETAQAFYEAVGFDHVRHTYRRRLE